MPSIDSKTKAHRGINNPRGLKDIPLRIEPASAADRSRARRLADALRRHYPDAHCELDYTSPHELLVSTILSAQTTDVQVNKAAPALFGRFPTPADFAASSPEQIEPFVNTLGFFRNKAKSVFGAMTIVASEHAGRVPQTMDELLALPGVARKTANVVLSNAFDIQAGFVVDTHVQRLAWRFGLVEQPKMDPKKAETRLIALFPRTRWGELSHQLIWHGRRACTARPNCAHDHAICKKYGINCPNT